MHGLIEKANRVCFLKQSVYEIAYPIFKTENEDGSPIQVITQKIDKGQRVVDYRESSCDDIYEWLMEMDIVFPDIPSFDILQTYLKPVCPESIIDSEATQYYRLESAVQTYGVDALSLPYKTFEFFECVRSASNLFELIQNVRREKAAKSMNKGKH